MANIEYNWIEVTYEDGEVYHYWRGHLDTYGGGWRQFIGRIDETATLKLEHVEYTKKGLRFRGMRGGKYEFFSSVEEAKTIADQWLTEKGLI